MSEHPTQDPSDAKTPIQPASEHDPAPPQTARPASMYAQGSVANMLRSLLVIAAIMSLFVLVFPRLQPQTPDIDVVETAQQVEGSTGWDVSVPADLPKEWVPLRANYLRMAELMTWQVGFETPAGAYAALAQTMDATDSWVEQQVNRSPKTDPVDIAGRSWERYDRVDGKVQRSLVHRATTGELSTVVTGAASWEELEELAVALIPVTTSPAPSE